MQGGKKGLLVNSRNLCKAPARADVKMAGQNGKRSNSKPLASPAAARRVAQGQEGQEAPGQR